jgi:hypothetical protein
VLLERSTESWADLMAVFWVQRFYTLPIVIENIGMGNEPPQRELPAEAVDQLGKFTFPIIMGSRRLERGRLLMWRS